MAFINEKISQNFVQLYDTSRIFGKNEIITEYLKWDPMKLFDAKNNTQKSRFTVP